MDNPLYDHQLDGYPPVPGLQARSGRINRETPNATQAGQAKDAKSGVKARVAIWSPPRKPPRNPARAPGPVGPKSASTRGRGSFAEWFAGLSLPGVIGVGLVAGVLGSTPLFLAILLCPTGGRHPEGLPGIEAPGMASAFASSVAGFIRLWPVYTGTVILACGLTIWGRRWSVQAELTPCGDYGLSTQELTVLAGESLSQAVVASWLVKGVVYRPPKSSLLLSLDRLPDDADALERALYASLPLRDGLPPAVSRLEESLLLEHRGRLQERGMLVSEARENTLRAIRLASWAMPALLALDGCLRAPHAGSASIPTGVAGFLLIVHLAILGLAFGRVPPLPRLTRRGRHALEMAKKSPAPIGPPALKTTKGRPASQFRAVPTPRLPAAFRFTAPSRRTDALSSKGKRTMEPVDPGDCFEWDRLEAPLKGDEDEVAKPRKSFLRRPISDWFLAPYEVTDLGDRVRVVLSLPGPGQKYLDVLPFVVLCWPVGPLFWALVGSVFATAADYFQGRLPGGLPQLLNAIFGCLLIIGLSTAVVWLVLKGSLAVKLTVEMSAGQLVLHLGGRYDRRVTIPRKELCLVRTLTQARSGGHRYDVHLFKASGQIMYLSEFIEPIAGLPSEVIRLGKQMRRILGVPGDDLKV
jgi:uncharacterized protein (TIGR04222 family)